MGHVSIYSLVLVRERLPFGQKLSDISNLQMSEQAKKEVSAFSCHRLIDLCCFLFLRKGVSRDADERNQWWSSKWLHFLLCRQTGSAVFSPTVIDWFSLVSQEWVSRDADCNGQVQNGFTFYLAAKQKVPAFSCIKLMDVCRFHRKGVSWDAQQDGED